MTLWSHLQVLLDQLKERELREWYLHAAVEYGWSRDVLVLQIKSRLWERERKGRPSPTFCALLRLPTLIWPNRS
jgi:predicted nuclease of restriction endonuclease-like (RecB) superfamily